MIGNSQKDHEECTLVAHFTEFSFCIVFVYYVYHIHPILAENSASF